MFLNVRANSDDDGLFPLMMDDIFREVSFGIGQDGSVFNFNISDIGPSTRRSRLHVLPSAMSALLVQILAAGDLSGIKIIYYVHLDFDPGLTPPASRAEIASIPRRTLTQNDLSKYDMCSICLEKYKVNEEIMTLQCTHVFHSSCLTTWLQQVSWKSIFVGSLKYLTQLLFFK